MLQPSRISKSEGVFLFTTATLQELQDRAQKMRLHKHPHETVTFVLDTNPNYTNICDVSCTFCAFRRTKEAKDAYHKTPELVMKDIKRAYEAGLTTVLLQGGLHESVTIEYLVALVKSAKEEFPSIHPHFFSAPEIAYAAKKSKVSIQEALCKLYDAGLRTIPGGGAEILSSKVQQRICPNKLTPQEWIQVHMTAHRIGFLTTATMMYGHVETPEDIVEHLDVLRSAQDSTGGFLSFIPWSYKRENNPLGRYVLEHASPEMYLRIIAFSRLFLDNFDHITASWFGEGKPAGIQALHYGADDFGGTIAEEAVHKATGHINITTKEEVMSMIREAGYEPAQRDSFYKLVI